jgi:hypothetical protein
MGWGNPQPLAELKRQASRLARETARADAAEAELATLRADLDRLLADCDASYPDETFPRISAFVVRAALVPRSKCPMCFSAYNDCPVHR